MTNFIDAVLKTLLNSEMAGLVVNPWGNTFFLSRALAELLFQADEGREYAVRCVPDTPDERNRGDFTRRMLTICKRNPSRMNQLGAMIILRSCEVYFTGDRLLTRNGKRFLPRGVASVPTA